MPVPTRPPDPALRSGPAPYREARKHESPSRLRGPAYRRPTRGVYRAADAQAGDHGDAVRVFRAAIGEGGVLGGPSAAWALGIRLASPRDDVEVVFPPERRLRARDGLRVRGDRLLPGEIVETPFGLATAAARTAFDLARRAGPDRALAWVDAVLRGSVVGGDAIREVIAAHPHVRGLRQAESVLAIADPRSESPRESMLRWAVLDAGLPAPTPQFVVRDGRNGFVARLDLAWPELKVAAEYDGAHHRDPEQHSRDLARHNRLRSLGWIVVQVDAAQLRDPASLIALLRGLLARQGR